MGHRPMFIFSRETDPNLGVLMPPARRVLPGVAAWSFPRCFTAYPSALAIAAWALWSFSGRPFARAMKNRYSLYTTFRSDKEIP